MSTDLNSAIENAPITIGESPTPESQVQGRAARVKEEWWDDRDQKAPNSPWGRVQSRNTAIRGVHLVTTASHGGILISKGLASKILTPAALKFGFEYFGYLAFEEDCSMTIPLFEHQEWLAPLGLNAKEITVADLIKSGDYYDSYIAERGLKA